MYTTMHFRSYFGWHSGYRADHGYHCSGFEFVLRVRATMIMGSDGGGVIVPVSTGGGRAWMHRCPGNQCISGETLSHIEGDGQRNGGTQGGRVGDCAAGERAGGSWQGDRRTHERQTCAMRCCTTHAIVRANLRRPRLGGCGASSSPPSCIAEFFALVQMRLSMQL